MKAIIPVAGLGTRLRPHTYTVPKVLFPVAGKPMLAHILDELVFLGVDEVTFIVHHLGEAIESWVRNKYDFECNFVDQEKLLGLGHAIKLTESLHRDDDAVLIILGDTIFRTKLSPVLKWEENAIGVKAVEDPRRFGIVELEDNRVTRLIEKPENPPTNLAIVGIYHITRPALLYDCLNEIISEGKTTKGEIQLTDALQRMLDRGARFRTFEIDDWLDCGKPETLLDTNKRILQKIITETQTEAIKNRYPSSVFKPPVSIEESAVIEGSIVGPFVTICDGAVIENSIVENSIIDKNAKISNLLIESSLIGENAQVNGIFSHFNVGDSTTIDVG